MLAGNVPSMSSILKAAVVLTSIVSVCESKPVGTMLGSGIDVFNLLDLINSDNSKSITEDFLSKLISKTIFVNPITTKWVRNSMADGDKFRIILCDSIYDLYQALDGNFRIAGFDHITSKKNTGDIPSKYLSQGYSYVLIKYSRVKHFTALKAAASLTPEAEGSVEQIDLNRPETVLNFVKKFGTHYISSFSTGESIYQIYVYHTEKYDRLRWKMKKTGRTDVINLQNLLSPYYFEYAGPIKTSSGDNSAVEWSDRIFFSPFLLQRYLEIRKNERLLGQFRKELDHSETFLSLKLNGIERAIVDPEKKEAFLEVLDNQMKLYEANL